LKHALGDIRIHAMGAHSVIGLKCYGTRLRVLVVGVDHKRETGWPGFLKGPGNIRKRLVGVRLAERLQEDPHEAVATDAKAPEFIILHEIVGNTLRLSRIDDGGRAQDQVTLETATGQHSLEPAVAHEYEWLTSLPMRLEKLRKRRRIHAITDVE
jgi:hypothetical protein